MNEKARFAGGFGMGGGDLYGLKNACLVYGVWVGCGVWGLEGAFQHTYIAKTPHRAGVVRRGGTKTPYT